MAKKPNKGRQHRKRVRINKPDAKNPLAMRLNAAKPPQEYAQELVSLQALEDGLTGEFRGKVPSVNQLTLDVHNIRRRAATAQVKTFKKYVRTLLATQNAISMVPEAKWYTLYLCVAFPLYDQGGGVIRKDASNFIKVPEDAISVALGLDDSRFLRVAIEKVDSPDNLWRFELRKV